MLDIQDMSEKDKMFFFSFSKGWSHEHRPNCKDKGFKTLHKLKLLQKHLIDYDVKPNQNKEALPTSSGNNNFSKPNNGKNGSSVQEIQEWEGIVFKKPKNGKG